MGGGDTVQKPQREESVMPVRLETPGIRLFCTARLYNLTGSMSRLVEVSTRLFEGNGKYPEVFRRC